SDYRTRKIDTPQFQSHLKRIRNYFGTWKAIEVSAESVEGYIADMREQEYSDATINRGTQLLAQAYGLAVRRKKVATAPDIQHLSEIGNERQGIFTAADFAAVVEKLPEYLKDFARFGFITGRRKGSISKLRWTDVSDTTILFR